MGMPPLWPPQENGLRQVTDLLQKGEDSCLYGPTGSGKTRMAIELAQWGLERGLTTAFYVNRRLLITQTARRFAETGIPFGVLAAGHQEMLNRGRPVQIISTLTEWCRHYQRGSGQPTIADIIIIDEAHLQKALVMNHIIKDHRSRGARIVLMTATPIGLSGIVNNLVVSGTLQQYRQCKALIPAQVRSIEQPDMRKVKRNRVGEYVLSDKKIQVYVQAIVGNVIRKYEEYNPDRRPTLLYAPCVSSSVWITEHMNARGHAWAHVDANDAVVDGERTKLSHALWDDIRGRLVDGSIKGISSRFKLREGVDIPEVYHCILATPMGSVASYLQTTGRILRYSPQTPDLALITDHGGNYWRHGSPNHDRNWAEWWAMSECQISTSFRSNVQEGRIQEPIRCPKCELERTGGITCPGCGFTHPKSKRFIIQETGELIEREGKLIRPKLVKLKPDTQKLWDRQFWAARKHSNRTFTQLEGWFFYKHHYYPPRNLNHMPLHYQDWCRHVKTMETEAIRWPEKK